MPNSWTDEINALYGPGAVDFLSGNKAPNVTVTPSGWAIDVLGDGSMVIGDKALVAQQHANGTLQSSGNNVDPNSVLGQFLGKLDWHSWLLGLVVLVLILTGIGIAVRR